MNLTELAKQIHQSNKDKGFWDKELNIGEKLMLVVTELSEALETHRKGNGTVINANTLYELGNVKGEAFIQYFENIAKDSFGDELGDAIIRILDLAGGIGVDIGKHIDLKLRYNSTRPHKHGKNY